MHHYRNSSHHRHTLDVAHWCQFFDSFDTVLIHSDGVLWRNTHIKSSIVPSYNYLLGLKKKIYIITKDALVVAWERCKKARLLVFRDEIISPPNTAAKYLKSKNVKRIYVSGRRSMTRDFDLMKIKHFGIGPDDTEKVLRQFVDRTLKSPSKIQAVVLDFDVHFNYCKMLRIIKYLRDPECEFLALNTHNTHKCPLNGNLPGAGIILSVIEQYVGRRAVRVCAPDPFLCRYLINNVGVEPSRTLLIGSNCDVHLRMGYYCGFKTMLIAEHSENCEERYQRHGHKAEVPRQVPDVFLHKFSQLRHITLAALAARCLRPKKRKPLTKWEKFENLWRK